MVLYVMIGPSGSGKSTLAKTLAGPEDKIISTDAIRFEIFGDEENQSNGALVFKIAKERARQSLKDGVNVIFDATNCITKYRKQLVNDIINGINNVKVIGVVKMPSLSVCLERNKKRKRHVPEDVINKQYNNLKYNLPEEGEFDEVLWYNN